MEVSYLSNILTMQPYDGIKHVGSTKLMAPKGQFFEKRKHTRSNILLNKFDMTGLADKQKGMKTVKPKTLTRVMSPQLPDK